MRKYIAFSLRLFFRNLFARYDLRNTMCTVPHLTLKKPLPRLSPERTHLRSGMPIPDGTTVRASHFLIKHERSRNPVSRRTNESTAHVTLAAAKDEMQRWMKELSSDPRPMAEKFAALAFHRSDCGSFEVGGDLGTFGAGEMQAPFEDAAYLTPVGEVSKPVQTDSGLHIIFRTA